jgi:cytochrome P450 family 135
MCGVGIASRIRAPTERAPSIVGSVSTATTAERTRLGSVGPIVLPAGPRRPGVLQSLEYGLDPYGYFRRAHRRFGDVFTVHVVGEEWVMLAHPDAVREVFAHGPDELDSGQANLPLRPILGTRNVLLLDGAEHLRRRKLVLPPFHGERMKAYEGIVTEVARRDLAGWPAGKPFPVLPRMQAMTFEVIMRAVFGVEEASRLDRLRRVLSEFLSWTTNWRRAAVFALLGPERVMALRGFQRQLAQVDAEVLGEIAKRREARDLADREDVLSLLLQARDEDGQSLSDRELRDELVTLLVAGHETTAAALAWALSELADAPEVQERLAAGENALSEAVVTETLRLHPPVPLGALRRLREPLRIGGRNLPAGATVAACALLVHRRPDLYERPDDFVPDRFVNAKPPPGGWLPFGGGVRRCVGAAFAQFEARLVLEKVAQRFVVAQPPGRRPIGIGRRGIVLVPRRGGQLVAIPRD